MKVINEEYKFSFEIPDGYEEICRDDYRKYHIDEMSTLNIFINYQDSIPRTISLNRDDEAKDEKEYLDLVHLNIQNMEDMDMHVVHHLHQTLNNRRVDIIYSNFKRLTYVTYFTVIRKMMVACSIEIEEINDENDQILEKMFESIEEID